MLESIHVSIAGNVMRSFVEERKKIVYSKQYIQYLKEI